MAHFKIWGCLAEVKICNPLEKKLDIKSTFGYFIRYLNRLKWYKFYCFNCDTKIIKSFIVKFLEKDIGDSESSILKEVFVEPNQVVSFSIIQKNLFISRLKLLVKRT